MTGSTHSNDSRVRALAHFIGGRALDGASDRYGDVFDPALGTVTARVPLASGVQTNMATPALARFGSDALRDEFLANYAADLCVHTTLFPGIGALLDDLDARGVRWGIVTNKAARFTDPLVALLGLAARAACVVSGDTASHPKPHPAPLLYAADRLSLAPERIVYVGDDLRDIQAGSAAGMPTVAAAYGYCGDGAAPADWRAQHLVETTDDLQRLLRVLRYNA